MKLRSESALEGGTGEHRSANPGLHEAVRISLAESLERRRSDAGMTLSILYLHVTCLSASG